MKPQTKAVLRRLRRGPLTPLQALREIGTMRLGARIYELRLEGHDIRTDIVQRGGAHVARYRLG